MKILAIKLRALGDTVIWTASLDAIRETWPDARVHALVPREWAPVLDGSPSVDRVMEFRGGRGVGRVLSLANWAAKLRGERYDRVLVFHASPSAAWLARATGAPERAVHFHGHRDANRFSTVEIAGKGQVKPSIERDLDVLRAFGAEVLPGKLPRVALSAPERETARRWVASAGLGGQGPGRGRILAVGLGASRPTKDWGADRMATLAVDWVRGAESGGSSGGVIVFSGPGEGALLDRFLHEMDDMLSSGGLDPESRARARARVIPASGLPIRQVAALLAEASVYCGNDSGLKHLSVAVGTPTVTLFGPEHPLEWHPYSREAHPYFFVESLTCRRDADPGMPPWCALKECVVEQHRCMRLIGVDPVLRECLGVAKPVEN